MPEVDRTATSRAARVPGAPYALVASLLLILWATVAVAVIVTFALTAWGNESDATPPSTVGEPPAPPEPQRPAGVPADASFVRETLLDGSVGAGGFFHLACADDLLTIVTTRAIVYARMPCARSLSRPQIDRLLGQRVEIGLVNDELSIRAAGGQFHAFPVDAVWIREM